MTGDGNTDGLAAGGRTDAPTFAAPRLAAGGVDVPSPVCSAAAPEAPNPVREIMQREVARLERMTRPTLEQIERKLFLKEYLAQKF